MDPNYKINNPELKKFADINKNLRQNLKKARNRIRELIRYNSESNFINDDLLFILRDDIQTALDNNIEVRRTIKEKRQECGDVPLYIMAKIK